MGNQLIKDLKVYSTYLDYRKQALEYTYHDMNLRLDNDSQVYLAVFDMPLKSGIVGYQTQTLVLIFGLNTHIYHGSGRTLVGLEKSPGVMKAMQSLLISSSQVLPKCKLTSNTDFFNSDYVRAYLKTRKGIYYKELNDDSREDKFLLMLLNMVMTEINQK